MRLTNTRFLTQTLASGRLGGALPSAQKRHSSTCISIKGLHSSSNSMGLSIFSLSKMRLMTLSSAAATMEEDCNDSLPRHPYRKVGIYN